MALLADTAVGALMGAVGNLVESLLTWEFSWSKFFEDVAIGAVTGAAGSLLGFVVKGVGVAGDLLGTLAQGNRVARVANVVTTTVDYGGNIGISMGAQALRNYANDRPLEEGVLLEGFTSPISKVVSTKIAGDHPRSMVIRSALGSAAGNAAGNATSQVITKGEDMDPYQTIVKSIKGSVTGGFSKALKEMNDSGSSGSQPLRNPN